MPQPTRAKAGNTAVGSGTGVKLTTNVGRSEDVECSSEASMRAEREVVSLPINAQPKLEDGLSNQFCTSEVI